MPSNRYAPIPAGRNVQAARRDCRRPPLISIITRQAGREINQQRRQRARRLCPRRAGSQHIEVEQMARLHRRFRPGRGGAPSSYCSRDSASRLAQFPRHLPRPPRARRRSVAFCAAMPGACRDRRCGQSFATLSSAACAFARSTEPIDSISKVPRALGGHGDHRRQRGDRPRRSGPRSPPRQ